LASEAFIRKFCNTLLIAFLYGKNPETALSALRNLADETIFIAEVIFCVDLTDCILVFISFKDAI